MKNLTPINEFTTPVPCIEDGTDELKEAIFEAMVQALANRTEFNKLAAAEHAALTNPHSAASAATANRIALRDANGRCKFAEGAATGDAVVFSQFANNKAESGYQRLPNGLIIQWGVQGSYAGVINLNYTVITFPIAFPNACFTVVSTPMSSYGGSTAILYSSVQTWNATTVTFPSTLSGRTWMAIGS